MKFQQVQMKQVVRMMFPMKSQKVQMMRFQQVEKIQQTEKIQLVQKMFQLVVQKMMQQQWQQHLNCSGHLQAPSSMDPTHQQRNKWKFPNL